LIKKEELSNVSAMLLHGGSVQGGVKFGFPKRDASKRRPFMIILKEKQKLDEMATVSFPSDGIGVNIVVHSNDHLPKHAHLTDSTGKNELGRFVITDNLPRRLSDILEVKETISAEYKKMLIDWAPKRNKKVSDKTNWKALDTAWKILH
jgi:hypothetical protein